MKILYAMSSCLFRKTNACAPPSLQLPTLHYLRCTPLLFPTILLLYSVLPLFFAVSIPAAGTAYFTTAGITASTRYHREHLRSTERRAIAPPY